MSCYKLSLLLCILFLGSAPTKASFHFNSDCRQAYSMIYALKFSSAKAIIEEQKKIDPTNHIILVLENNIDFLTLIISEDEKLYNSLKSNLTSRLEILEKGDNGSPYYLYSQAELYLQWGFAKLKFGDYISAVSNINSAYKLLVKNQQLFPQFILNKKELGLLHIIIGSIPDQYKWAADIIGLEGNTVEGIKEIQTVLDLSLKDPNYSYVSTECYFLLAFIYMNITQDIKQMADYYQRIQPIENTNLLLCFVKSKMASLLGKNDDVIKILSERPKTIEYFSFPYLEFLLGKAKLNKMDPTAITNFQIFLSQYKGRNYLKSAYQKIAWYYLAVKNDHINYTVNIQKVKNVGYTDIGEDQDAQQEAEYKLLPSSALIKARLYFDGGYYLKALESIINSNTFSSQKEQVEFYYRIGRIYQMLGNNVKAISYYQTVIEEGNNMPYYYVANAVYQLGYIYETMGNRKVAETFYKKCVELKNHPYKDSIDQKAKAGINRVKLAS